MLLLGGRKQHSAGQLWLAGTRLWHYEAGYVPTAKQPAATVRVSLAAKHNMEHCKLGPSQQSSQDSHQRSGDKLLHA